MRIRLWVGIGSWVMASGLPNAMPGDDADWSLEQPVRAAPLASGEGGEGGDPSTGVEALQPSPLAADARLGVGTMLVLLAEARQEYERAVLDGAIREPLEYHGSRGLFLIARQAFDRVAGDLRARDPETVASLATSFDQLAAAWPAATLPAAVMSPGEVTAAIAQIEQAASRLSSAA
jgi:hypothetical protein